MTDSHLGCKVPVGLVEALDECGVSHAQVLATARLPRHMLDVPGPRVSVADYFALWHAIREVSGDPNIGISLATSVKSDHTEPLFLAILSALDVDAAINVLSRHKRVLQEPQHVSVTKDSATQRVVLTFDWPPSLTSQPQVLADAELACIIEMCRRGTRAADFAPMEIQLRATALESRARHAEFFRSPIQLGAPRNAVVFSVEDTSRPFVTHNPQLLRALLPYLEANTPQSAGAAISRIRSVIAERVRGQRPTVRTVGRELAMSGRALQRALRNHGTSFRQLLDEVRNEYARGYLSATSFSDSEVAFLLGFEEANSFYRAFRSWNGVSPNEFRRRAQSASLPAASA